MAKLEADFILIFLHFSSSQSGWSLLSLDPVLFVEKLYGDTSFKDAHACFCPGETHTLPYPLSVCWQKTLTLNVWFHGSKARAPTKLENAMQSSAEWFGQLYHLWGHNF